MWNLSGNSYLLTADEQAHMAGLPPAFEPWMCGAGLVARANATTARLANGRIIATWSDAAAPAAPTVSMRPVQFASVAAAMAAPVPVPNAPPAADPFAAASPTTVEQALVRLLGDALQRVMGTRPTEAQTRTALASLAARGTLGLGQ